MEIKKAFEIFKKELEKETGIAGGFVMNRKQIASRTATYTVATTVSFEKTLDMYIRDDEKVQSYASWTTEAKARAHERYMENINRLKAYIEKYGTREKYVEEKLEVIKNSSSFAKFEQEVGETTLTIEIDSDKFYKIRFNY